MLSHGDLFNETYVNDAGVTRISRPASDSLNVGAVGYCVDGHAHGHDPVFHSRSRDRVNGLGLDRNCDRRGHCHYRVNGRGCDHGPGHSLFGGHSPSYRARSAWSHIACRRGDDRPFLARPSRSETDRASPYNESDSRAGRSRRREDASAAGEIYEESVDAFLGERDLGAPQSRVWVEVGEWKTLEWIVCRLFALHLAFAMFGTVTVRRGLYPLASLSQIQSTPSAQDGVPCDIEEDLRAYGCRLIHQAGILLNQCVTFCP
jgi:hypothetical protein